MMSKTASRVLYRKSVSSKRLPISGYSCLEGFCCGVLFGWTYSRGPKLRWNDFTGSFFPWWFDFSLYGVFRQP